MIKHFWLDEKGVADKWLGRIALVVASLTVVYLAFNWWFAPNGVPVVMERVETLNSPIRAGQPVRVRIYREKLRDDCPVDSTRIAISADGEVYQLQGRTWEGGPQGEPSFTYEYPTPRDLPPGNYTLRVRLVYFCPEETFLVEQSDAFFRVVE